MIGPKRALTPFLVAALLCACMSGPPIGDDADRAAIEDFNAHYVQAINDGDIDALAALTTDDHIMLAPNRPPLVGKEANIEAMARVFDQTEIDEEWVPLETVVAGDWAYQRGTFSVGARPRGETGEMRVVSGSFLRIYRRQPNGAWRMIRDMFNTYE
jgi:ketosteroid isomerase-like protein